MPKFSFNAATTKSSETTPVPRAHSHLNASSITSTPVTSAAQSSQELFTFSSPIPNKAPPISQSSASSLVSLSVSVKSSVIYFSFLLMLPSSVLFFFLFFSSYEYVCLSYLQIQKRQQNNVLCCMIVKNLKKSKEKSGFI